MGQRLNSPTEAIDSAGSTREEHGEQRRTWLSLLKRANCVFSANLKRFPPPPPDVRAFLFFLSFLPFFFDSSAFFSADETQKNEYLLAMGEFDLELSSGSGDVRVGHGI